ncbi:MAG: DUF885 domain-containing protein [Pirellulaceae bacterium]|nr:DUF885 domain-containing protein [Pirellulaceae bacterium]
MLRIEDSVFWALCLLMGVFTNQAKADSATDSGLKQLFSDYHEQFLIIFPLEATSFGDSRYNDQLQIDISEEFLAKEKRFYESTLNRLEKIDSELASDTLRLSAEILRYELQIRLAAFPFKAERIPFTQFEGLPIGLAQMGSGTGTHPFKSVKDYEDWLKRLEAFSTWSLVAIERFREGATDEFVLPTILVERMIEQLLDKSIVSDDPTQSLFYKPIERMPKSFSTQDQQRLTTAYQRAVAELVIPAYRRMGVFLRDEYLPKTRTTSGVSTLPNGKDYYRYCVRYWTTTTLTPDEIYAIGEREVARIRNEMELVRQQMRFEGDLTEFFEDLRTDPQYKPFESPEAVLAFFVAIQTKLEPMLDKAFSSRPKTPFEIRRTETFREKTASAEYMPGNADGSRPGIFYVPIPDALDFNITSGMESLFLHEALPGHHYQISLQQENESLPPFARFLWYGAYGEGWALYCESIGSELGLYSDPKQRIGALGDEMHRAIRLVVDVGLHWKGWTREQAIEFMMANEPLSLDGTIAEIERYMAYPGQALSYKMGQLKITELRKKCEQRLGDRFSIAAFHDQLLRNGSMPLDVLERRIQAWDPQDLR